MHRSWIIWYAITVHLWWGIEFLLTPPSGADWHGGVFWNIYINMGGETFWAWAMLVAAVMATVALFMKRGRMSLLLLLPQQAILTLGAIGIVTAFYDVFYVYELSRVMRVAPTAIGAFVFHTLAILDYYGVLRWKT